MGAAAKRRKRAERNSWRSKLMRVPCVACGKPGSHFVPPSLGDEGFFYCTQVLLDGKAVPR